MTPKRADLLSDEKWLEIKTAFIAGTSVETLAERFQIKASRIYKRSAREKWAEAREKCSEQIEENAKAAFEHAKEEFKLSVALSYKRLLAMCERIISKLKTGDVDGFNTAISALVKLHHSGLKHFNLAVASEQAIIVAGKFMGRAEPDEE